MPEHPGEAGNTGAGNVSHIRAEIGRDISGGEFNIPVSVAHSQAEATGIPRKGWRTGTIIRPRHQGASFHHISIPHAYLGIDATNSVKSAPQFIGGNNPTHVTVIREGAFIAEHWNMFIFTQCRPIRPQDLIDGIQG